MKNIRLINILAFCICLIMTVMLVLTMFSGILLIGADRIVYAENGIEFQVSEVDFISMKFRTGSRSNYGSSVQWQEQEISWHEALKIKIYAALSQIPLWMKEYKDDSSDQVLQYWTIEMHRGNIVHRSTGSSIRPIGWNMLIPKLERMAEKLEKAAPKDMRIPTDKPVADI